MDTDEKLTSAELAEVLRNCKQDFPREGESATKSDRLVVKLLEHHARSAEAGHSVDEIRRRVVEMGAATVNNRNISEAERTALIAVAYLFHYMEFEGSI